MSGKPNRAAWRTWLLMAMALLPMARAAAAPQGLTIAGGSPAGVYYIFAERTCDLINAKLPDRYRCHGRSTLGSVFNIKAVSARVMQMGVAQSDQQFLAWRGEGQWGGNRPKNLRSVLSLHLEYLYLMARADRGIKTVADLRGKRVNIGNPGSGHRQMAEDVLRLHGVDWRRDFQAEGFAQGVASQALIDGEIDAFFYSVGLAAPAIASPAAAVPVVLVPLDSEAVRNFVDARPFYLRAPIPGGIYAGIKADVPTYAVAATVITAAEVPEGMVYDLVRLVFENLDFYRGVHPAFSRLEPQRMLEGLSAPLHPGALRYYQERGWR